MTDLEGRVIAIAGAGGGLGPVVAQRLADAGASLSLADRSQEIADGVAHDLGLPEDRVRPPCRRPPRRGRRRRLGRRGREALRHESTASSTWSAAIAAAIPSQSFDLADYEFLHDLLVRTLQLATRAFHSALTQSAHGRFILVSSAAAQNPESTNAAYASAKAAAEAWTLSLADSFAGTPATANIIVVNAIETPGMREESPETERPTFTPAEDLADAIAFISSDSAARMNGQRVSLHP